MGAQNKGFFDGLIEDFGATMEMKGAIEASRDATGKVDAAKAAGIAAGLGHTSDNDLFIMDAMLRAEGAYDGGENRSVKPDSYSAGSPAGDASVSSPGSADPITRWPDLPSTEYLRESRRIAENYQTAKRIWIVVLCVAEFLLLFLVGKFEEAAVFWVILMLAVAALSVVAIFSAGRTHDRELTELNVKERRRKEREKAEQSRKAAAAKAAEEEKKREATQAADVPARSVDAQQVKSSVDLVRSKMKLTLSEADERCGCAEPTFSEGKLAAFLSSLFYFAVKHRAEPTDVKMAIFDRMVLCCELETDFTGEVLFSDWHGEEPDDMLQELVIGTFRTVDRAAKRTDFPDDGMVFALSVCGLMILLSGMIEPEFGIQGLFREGIDLVFDFARRAGINMDDDELTEEEEE